MTGLFKQKNPLNLILLFVFAVLIKLPVFKSGYLPVPQPADGVFYKAIVAVLMPWSQSFPPLFSILAFLILLVQALLLNIFLNSHRMLNRQNFLPGMSYLLITSLLPEWNLFSAPLLASTFLILIFIILFKTYNQQQAKTAVFYSGLLLGIAVYIFPPALAFLLWLLLGMMIIRPYRPNEWFLIVMGLLTPVYFYSAYLFLYDQWSWQGLLPRLGFGLPRLEQNLLIAGGLLLLVLPFLTGAWYVQDNLRKMLINIRKAWSLFLIYLFVAIAVPFLQPGDGLENWILIAVPFAAFHAGAYMFTVWRLITFLFFWISVAFILFCQYYAHSWY